MIKVLLIEDHQVLREGIASMLSRSRDKISLVGSVSTGKAGLEISREKTPHVVILDFQLPDTNGLEITRKLLRYNPDLKILIMTGRKNATLALQLLEAGVAGYLTKDYGFYELEQAIRSVHCGQRYISSDMASQLALHNVLKPDHNTPFDNLSTREMEIVLGIANGLTPEAIANQLHIAQKTVHSYRYRIFEKLNIKNDLELLRLALKFNIVELDDDPTDIKK